MDARDGSSGARRDTNGDRPAEERRAWVDALWALGLVAAAATLRFLFAAERSILIDHDSAAYLIHARQILQGELFHTFMVPGYPLLIALWTLVVEDFARAARIASLVSGSLLPAAVFLTGRALYGRGVGALAGVLVTVNVALIEISTWELSEPTYILSLFVAASLTLWALRNRRWLAWSAAGLAFGFCYWVRPEGALYLLLVPAVVLGVEAWRAGRLVPPRALLAGLAVFVLAGSLLVAPAVLHNHRETGLWTLSTRTVFAALVLSQPMDEPLAGERALYTLNAAGDSVAMERTREARMTESFADNLPFKAKEAVKTLERTNRLLPSVFPILLLLFVGIGLFGLRWTMAERWSELVLGGMLLPWAFVYPLYEIDYENLAPVVPFLSLWAGLGIWRIARAVPRQASSGRWRAGAVVLATLGILLILEFRPYVYAVRNPDTLTRGKEDHPVHREVAAWVRANLPEDSRLIARKLFIPAYAARPSLPLPLAGYGETVEFARQRGGDVLVAEERFFRLRPELQFLLEEDARTPGLRRLYENREVPGRTVVLYEVLPDAGSDLLPADDSHHSPSPGMGDAPAPPAGG